MLRIAEIRVVVRNSVPKSILLFIIRWNEEIDKSVYEGNQNRGEHCTPEIHRDVRENPDSQSYHGNIKNKSKNAHGENDERERKHGS